MFLAHNTALAPPYRVLIDTNFINFSLQNKLELMGGMMDCLYAKCELFRLLVTVHHPCGSFLAVAACCVGRQHTEPRTSRYPMRNRLCDGRVGKAGS